MKPQGKPRLLLRKRPSSLAAPPRYLYTGPDGLQLGYTFRVSKRVVADVGTYSDQACLLVVPGAFVGFRNAIYGESKAEEVWGQNKEAQISCQVPTSLAPQGATI